MKTDLLKRHWLGAQPQAGTAALPDDLREWMSDDRLVRLAFEAVAELDPQQMPRRDFVHAGRAFPVAVMLTLLTYCYASGRFGSQEIEEALASDPLLRYLCAGDEPPSTAIRRFRRVYRGPLSVCLLRVFLAAALQPCDAHGWAKRGEPDGSANHRIETAAKAAEAAIAKAVFADTTALDV